MDKSVHFQTLKIRRSIEKKATRNVRLYRFLGIAFYKVKSWLEGGLYKDFSISSSSDEVSRGSEK